MAHPGAATRIARPGGDRPPTRRPVPRPAVLLLAATILAAGAVLASCGSDPEAGGEPRGPGAVEGNATVVRVVDGDTLVADLGGAEERVRLIGIDTPESVKQGAPVECFGKEASKHTGELLPEGTRVRLVLDVEERDRYERLLAYVYRASDGLFVNLALAADGYAGLLTYPPNVAHTDEFRRAVADARAAGAGLWGACAADPPVDH
ncbi:thermonuclease family protein [Dermatobacter hominis]|uniref:thermonuclease family protein n=1 Tax=Dermatobacter hominis TaxID=2884263 RepID=UPI001D0F62AC|nr:thermonuclease family protein [Dermatobacter hominis]UDY36983.1 thermonuclease family protein [Dermatobacter hominis]